MEGGTLVREWLIRPAHRESRKIAGGALHHGTGPRSGAPRLPAPKSPDGLCRAMAASKAPAGSMGVGK